jgi:hypothetical protein
MELYILIKLLICTPDIPEPKQTDHHIESLLILQIKPRKHKVIKTNEMHKNPYSEKKMDVVPGQY